MLKRKGDLGSTGLIWWRLHGRFFGGRDWAHQGSVSEKVFTWHHGIRSEENNCTSVFFTPYSLTIVVKCIGPRTSHPSHCAVCSSVQLNALCCVQHPLVPCYIAPHSPLIALLWISILLPIPVDLTLKENIPGFVAFMSGFFHLATDLKDSLIYSR